MKDHYLALLVVFNTSSSGVFSCNLRNRRSKSQNIIDNVVAAIQVLHTTPKYLFCSASFTSVFS
jgi:hypothetical protein